MSEIVWGGGSDMSITLNEDGTYTARVHDMQTICNTFPEAVVWCCSVREKGGKT